MAPVRHLAGGATLPAAEYVCAAPPGPWIAAIARILRAHTALNLGRRHAEAEADFQAAADTLAGLGERWGQAVAVGGLAQLASKRGDPATAVGHYRRASELAAVFGNNEDEVHFRLFAARELRARYPRFKSRQGRQSAEYTRSGFRWRDGPCGRWYVSLT